MPGLFPGEQLNSYLLPGGLLDPQIVIWKKLDTLVLVSHFKRGGMVVTEGRMRAGGPPARPLRAVPPGQPLLGLVPLELFPLQGEE